LPIATSGPNKISMWIISPQCNDQGTGVVFLSFFIVAKSPGSSTASAGVESSFILSRYNSGRYLFKVLTWQKPTQAQRRSSNIDIVIGRDDDAAIVVLIGFLC
jgi:hypothetical protein